MIHQRDSSPQIIVRPQSSYSTENLKMNNMNSNRIVQPVIIQDQVNRNIHTSINSVNKSI